MQPRDLAGVEAVAVEGNLSFWSRLDYQRHLDDKNGISLVAHDERKRIIGFLISRLIIYNKNDLNKNKQFNKLDETTLEHKTESKYKRECECELEIYNIAVSTIYRSKGVGKNLLDKCFELIGNCLETQVWLEVRRSNMQALNFYTANRFKISYVRKNYYSQPLEDALVLKRVIDGGE